MKEQMIHLQIRGEKKDYPLGTTYIELAEEYQQYYEEDIVLVLLNNRLRELSKTVETDGVVEFVTTGNRIGKKAYRRSVLLLMQKAVHNLYGEQGVTVRIMHSIGQGNYCELRGDMDVTQEVVLKLKMEMMRLCDANLPIEKRNMNTDEAVALFGRLGMRDKERLFGYRRSSRVNIYELDHYKDYFYGYMVPSTGYLKYFDLLPYKEGFMLLYPGTNSKVIDAFVPSEQLYQTLSEASAWGKTMGIGTVGALNDAIAGGTVQDIILVQEALMERKIGQLAERIASEKDKKFIMIAGPSSSGKTTFSHRLSIQLKALGLKPHPVPLDDFYLDRKYTPRDADGNYDFECLEALDVERFNHDMGELLAGKWNCRFLISRPDGGKRREG